MEGDRLLKGQTALQSDAHPKSRLSLTPPGMNMTPAPQVRPWGCNKQVHNGKDARDRELGRNVSAGQGKMCTWRGFAGPGARLLEASCFVKPGADGAFSHLSVGAERSSCPCSTPTASRSTDSHSGHSHLQHALLYWLCPLLGSAALRLETLFIQHFYAKTHWVPALLLTPWDQTRGFHLDCSPWLLQNSEQ